MKQLLLLLIVLSCTVGNAQSYLGKTTKQVNLRLEASTESEKLMTLKAGAQIFVITSELQNDFYNIIDIESNTEGFVHKAYVKLDKIVPRSTENLFNKSGTSASYEAELSIYNNTSKTMTLKMNSLSYRFSPGERRTIFVAPTFYNCLASAPGVLPYIGSESISSNTTYSWEFYITTR
jgi:hypothetical protein